MPLQPPITSAKLATNVDNVFLLGIMFILLYFSAFRKRDPARDRFDLAGGYSLTPLASQAGPNCSIH
jgi:hypothetical protein